MKKLSAAALALAICAAVAGPAVAQTTPRTVTSLPEGAFAGMAPGTVLTIGAMTIIIVAAVANNSSSTTTP